MPLPCLRTPSPSLIALVCDLQAQVIKPTGVQCPECSAEMKVPSLSVQLELQIRAHISKYYESVLVCDDPSCATTTRALGVYGRRCMVKDCRGQVHLQVSCRALFQ